MARRPGQPEGDVPARRRPSRPRRARAIEVRGRAEALATGGSSINPRFPNFAEEFLRIHPARIVSWGLADGAGTTAAEFRVNSRAVG